MRIPYTRAAWIIAAVLVIVTIAARVIPGARTIDDAFITFRYSRNLLDGAGFVYNPGVQTLGTTTPLFAAVMAVVGFIAGGRDFPTYAIGVSALADAASVVLLTWIARRAIAAWLISPHPPAPSPLQGAGEKAGGGEGGFALELMAAIPGLWWALAPMSVTFAIGGMETSVLILLMLAASSLFLASGDRRLSGRARGRIEAAIGGCAALGLLTRVDAALWIAPLFAWQLLSTRRVGWRTWLACAAIVIPAAAFSAITFGSIIPNSVTAKRFAYLVDPGSALAQLLRTYANALNTFDLFGSIGVMTAGVIFLALYGFAVLTAIRRTPRLLPLLAYPLIYFAAFSVINPLMFRWYNAPPLPAWGLAIALGLIAVLRPLWSRGRALQSIGAAIVIGVGAFGVVTTLSAWTLHPDHGADRPAPKMAWHAIELVYQQIGERLRDEVGVTPATRVGAADIGAVGYFSGATIVDTVGLVTPALTAYYPVDRAIIAAGQNYAIPPALIQETMPAYLVSPEGFLREGLAREAWFTESYALLFEIPFAAYGSAIQVYERQ